MPWLELNFHLKKLSVNKMKCPECKTGDHEDCGCVELKRVSVPKSPTKRYYWMEVYCCCGIMINEIGHKLLRVRK